MATSTTPPPESASSTPATTPSPDTTSATASDSTGVRYAGFAAHWGEDGAAYANPVTAVQQMYADGINNIAGQPLQLDISEVGSTDEASTYLPQLELIYQNKAT